MGARHGPQISIPTWLKAFPSTIRTWSRSRPRPTTKGSVWRITVSPLAILSTATSGTTRSSAGLPRTRGAAMRAVSAFFGAGIMDRYPDIRYCILESGFGWLPFWGARMDDQSIYMSYALPENLARKPSDYMTSGRFFASVVIHEGEKMARMVTDFLGDGVLMYSSDYPHAESRFPESTNKVLAWKSLGDEVMRKMLWDNATRCFGEP